MPLINNFYLNGAFAGMVAALIMSFLLILARHFKEIDFSFTRALGDYLFKDFLPEKFERVVGLILHLAIGAFFGIVYNVFSIKFDLAIDLLSGMAFSLLPWALMMLVFFPLFKKGIFGIKIGKHIRMVMLILHLIYGIVLGLLLSF
ncbi:MAG: DUF6789 family protein [Nanoarchaeota archaeon]|nr:DUF6789 family protein [Nanoarchaeota archaeon]